MMNVNEYIKLQRESTDSMTLVRKVGRIFSGPSDTMQNMLNLIQRNGISAEFVDSKAGYKIRRTFLEKNSNFVYSPFIYKIVTITPMTWPGPGGFSLFLIPSRSGTFFRTFISSLKSCDFVDSIL